MTPIRHFSEDQKRSKFFDFLKAAEETDKKVQEEEITIEFDKVKLESGLPTEQEEVPIERTPVTQVDEAIR